MSKLERVIKTVDLLIYKGKVENRRDLAEKLGYTESSLSQILNGKVTLSDKFIKKLSILNDNSDPNDIISGYKEKSTCENDNIVSEPEVEYAKSSIPYDIYKLTLENERINKLKEMELIKQNGQLIELLRKSIENNK